MTRINVVFVEPTMEMGGQERTLYDLIRGLDTERFNPVLCCLKGPDHYGQKLIVQGRQVHHSLINSKYDPRSVARVYSILRKEQAHIMYATNSPLNIAIGRTAASLAGVRACVTVVQVTFPGAHRRRRHVVNRLMLPFFGRIIAMSEMHKRYLVEHEKMPGEKIEVIYNGVDPSRFEDSSDILPLRHQLGIPDDGKLVGILARLAAMKTHDIFLRSAALVGKDLPDTHFLMAGDGPERPRLEELARDLGLGSRVHFLGWVEDVPRFLSALDVVALSSSYGETFPVAILEAMAASKPVVATNVGSLEELVIDGQTGYLVPPRQPEQFAQAVLRVLKAPSLAARLGEAGRRRVEQKFTVEHMVKTTECMFMKLLEEKGTHLAGIGHTLIV
jgi:glycosyltransferase involved in cell wall biosynthesis